MLISTLWRNRERPRFGSRRWGKMWAKRALTAWPLLRSAWRQARLAARGADIESPVFIAPCLLNGPAKNLRIGSGSFVGRANLHLHGRLSIGRNVVINDGATILTASHDVFASDFPTVVRAVTVEDHVWIATGATILPGVTIGYGAVIGAGAVVAKDIPTRSVAVGNPCRLLDRRREQPLDYRPANLVAAFEAWLGRGAVMDSSHRDVSSRG